MSDIVKMFNTKQYSLSNIKDVYYLTNNQGATVLKMYLPQFIIQLEDNKFAVGTGTNYYNRKSFSIFNYDSLTGKVEREFGCEYYGRDNDDYYTILRNIRKIYRNNKFLLQGNNRVFIYDTKTKEKLILKNMPNSIRVDSDPEGIKVQTTARSQYDDNITDQIEFYINNEGLPIDGFYSTLQDKFHHLITPEETAEIMHRDIDKVTYEDVLNTTYCKDVLYYLNNMSTTRKTGKR